MSDKGSAEIYQIRPSQATSETVRKDKDDDSSSFAKKERTSSSVEDPSTGGAVSPRHRNSYKADRDLEEKVRKACERISENVHICANEPSLALYRLAEHVRKALPPTVESRAQVQQLHQQLQGVHYDAGYGLEAVKSMERASPHLNNVQDLLKDALFFRQQLRHEQTRRSRKDVTATGSPTSMYQRLSAHLTSVDLPQIDLSEISRETKSRVETAFGSSRMPSGESSAAAPVD